MRLFQSYLVLYLHAMCLISLIAIDHAQDYPPDVIIATPVDGTESEVTPKTIEWHDCGDRRSVIKFDNLYVNPWPIKLGLDQAITFSADVSVLQAIEHGIQSDLEVRRLLKV